MCLEDKICPLRADGRHGVFRSDAIWQKNGMKCDKKIKVTDNVQQMSYNENQKKAHGRMFYV